MSRKQNSFQIEAVAALCCVLLCGWHVVLVESCKKLDRKCAVVSVGYSGVWCVTEHSRIWVRANSYNNSDQEGSSWQQVTDEPNLEVLDVGTDIVFGVKTVRSSSPVYYREGISRNNPKGSSWNPLQDKHERWADVTVSPAGNVYVTDMELNLYFRAGRSQNNLAGSSWERVEAEYPKSISAGMRGMWTVSRSGNVFYRTGTHGDPPNTKGTGFEKVSSDKIKVAVGSEVVALDENHAPWKRTGVSSSNPKGTGWTKLTSSSVGLLESIDTYNKVVWCADTRSAQYICQL